MSWFGYHYQVPQSARDVAEAFYAGKRRTRSNCWTDGMDYVLEDSVIARRVTDDQLPDEIARAVQGLPCRRLLEFTFQGWATKMTCRHLRALGIDAELASQPVYGPRGGVTGRIEVPLMNGRLVIQNRWYTREELALMSPWHPKPWTPPETVGQRQLAFA